MLLFSVLFPLVCGILIPALPLKNRRAVCGLAVSMQAIVTAALAAVVAMPEHGITILSVSDKIAIALKADGVAKLFCVLIGAGWLLVTVYACVYMKHEGGEGRFFACTFLTEAMLVGAALSSNLVSMYVFYELVTLCSMPMVLHSRSAESVRGALKYLFYSVAGAFMALFGIFVLAERADSLTFVSGGSLTEADPLVLAAVFVAVLGFGAKGGMFPLHGWLPTAHPVAPSPASALLSGLIAKAGVLAVIRVVYFVVGGDLLRGTWVQTALLILALLTVFMGSMMAYGENVLKKRLAYSTVSQISYVFCGLFLFTAEGFTGAALQIVFHAAVKICLFLFAGAVIYLTGKTKVDELTGLGKKMPVTLIAYTVASLSLIGIPPTGGFFAKWELATAALDGLPGAMGVIVPVVLLLSALLTAGYLLPISIRGFFPVKGEETAETRNEPILMWLPMVLLAAFAFIGGIFAAPITEALAALIG